MHVTPMKKIGKTMLFFSSYLLLFIILLIREIDNFFSTSNSKIPIIAMITVYSLFIFISIVSILVFKKSYVLGSPLRKSKICIKSVSDGSQEIVSYLITIVIPLVGNVSSAILNNDWVNLITMVLILSFIFLIYINSNLVVVNPMLIIFGYSINKIKFCYEQSPFIEFEGVLLFSDKQIDLISVSKTSIVDEIDENVFMMRRV